MIKRRKQIAKVLAFSMVFTTFASNASALEPRANVSSTLLAGENRYETAIKISESGWTSAQNAIIINGDKGLVDALTATPYASLKNAPILITAKDKLTPETKARLTKMGVKNVDIVGGEAVVSAAVENELKAMGITVKRIKGDDRYQTSVAVAEEIKKITAISKIAVVNGATGLPDAVSVAAPAADNKMPIILSDPANNNGVKEAQNFIKSNNISKSYVIGQTSAVSNSIMNSLPGTKTRLGGTDRHDTNAKVINEFYTQKELDNIYVAKSGYIKNNEELVDALAVGVLAAKNDDPVLIVGKSLGTTQEALLKEKNFDKITQVGKGIPTASIDAIKNTQSSVKEVKTVAELNTAISSARTGDVINFKPTSTVSSTVDISTTKDITVNLYNTYSSTVNVDALNATVNAYGTITGKLSVARAAKVTVQSGSKVTGLEIKSTATNTPVENKGTVTTFDVAASGVKINNTGTITTLNSLSDTSIEGSGTIGNMPVDPSKPVSQVSATSAKEIVVRFSKAIDVVPAITMTNVGSSQNITNADLIKTLSRDKRSVSITPKNGEFFNGSYDLVIDNILSGGVKQDKYTTTIKVEDKISPSITSVSFNQDTNKIEINLSEVIDITEETKSDLVLRINGVANEANIQLSDKPSNKIIIPNATSYGTSAKIEVAGLKDAVGNRMASQYSTTLSIPRNDLAVTSLTQRGINTIRVTFNKAMTNQDLLNSEFKVYLASDRNKAEVEIGNAVRVDEKNFDITVNTSKVFPGTTTSQRLNLEIVANALTDNTHVKNKAMTKTITMTKDVTAPTVTSVSLKSDKKAVLVNVSEEINVPASGKIKLLKNGVELNNVTVVKKDKILTITTSDSNAVDADGILKAGNYKVRVEAGAFTDLSGNAVKGYNSTDLVVTSSQTNKPAMNLDIVKTASNTFRVNTTGATVSATLSEDDKTFKYTGDLYKVFSIDGRTLPSNTEIKFVANGGVSAHANQYLEIKLPNDFIETTGNAELKSSGLEVVSGRSINSLTKTVPVIDNTAPTLETAQLVTVKDKKNTSVITEYQLKLNFDEAVKVDAVNILKGLKLSKGTAVFNGSNVACSYRVSGKGVKITILPNSLKGTNWTDIVNSGTTTLEVMGDSPIRDTQNIVARKGTKVTLSKTSINQ